MPYTSPKMSLRVWNLLQDPYDHAQLADNWLRVDQHDHSPGRGVQIPTEGIADSAITAAKLASDTLPSDYQTIFSTWNTTFRASGVLLPADGNSRFFTAYSGLKPLSDATAGTGIFHLDSTDWQVGSHIAKVRLRLTITTNATAPAQPFQALVHNVTASAGGAAAVTLTSTPQIPTIGTGAAIPAPAANSRTTLTGPEVTCPTGDFIVELGTSAAIAASSAVAATVEIQTRQT